MFEERSVEVRRFVAQMPVQLTRRQLMAVRLRYALEQQSGKRVAPCPTQSSPSIPGRHEPGRYDELLRSLDMPRGPPRPGGR